MSLFCEGHSTFGFIDWQFVKKMGNTKPVCELAIRAGTIVFGLNGI
jgi:hypothetical protein